MNRSWSHGSALLCALLVVDAHARACEPAKPAGDLERLPRAWRGAFEALIEATLDESKPWGCPDALVDLEVHDPGATLRVERVGAASMKRPLRAPEELVPLGKAMLARPLPTVRPIDRTLLTRDAAATWRPSEKGAPRRDPRAFVDAAGHARYAGVSDLIAMGASTRGTLPFGRWSSGLWIRYAEIVAELGGPTPDLDFSELVLGVSLTYDAVKAPVRLAMGVHGALAVVDMASETTAPNPSKQIEVESGAVEGRVGMEVRFSLPVRRGFGPLLALDGDLAPASLGSPDRRLDSRLPPLPAYSVGVSAGLELAIP